MYTSTVLRNALIKGFKNDVFLLHNTTGMKMPILIDEIANEKSE
ncbi:hypothetical protein BSBH6_01536 [Bacillus subtilis]|nr:hypothetical protein BSBH6_01536 [Bacillus subtilis]RPK25741.1 hypothetical protein BH5_02573 [Bacillus subtilis]